MDEKNELEKNSVSSNVSNETVPDIEIPNLRTYKQDISQTVSQDKVTTAKILMAEQNKRLLEDKIEVHDKVKTVKNTFAVLFSIVLLVASIGLVGYFGYTKVTTQSPIANPQASAFLFVYENEKFINISQSEELIEKEIEKTKIEVSQGAPNAYTELVFFETDAETKTNNRIDTLSFLRLFEISIPINVARSVSQDFTYGFYNNEGRTEPFLVIGLVDYENAYANMFLWENTLALDIKSIFPVLTSLFDISNIKGVFVNPQDVVALDTTEEGMYEQIDEQKDAKEENGSESETNTAEQTISENTPTPTEQDLVETINREVRFTDVVLSNYNTRAVRNENGSPFFYYSFIGKEKLLFAQDPKLIGDIIRKMKQRQLVR